MFNIWWMEVILYETILTNKQVRSTFIFYRLFSGSPLYVWLIKPLSQAVQYQIWEGIFFFELRTGSLFCGYAVKLLVPNTAFRLVDASQAPRDTTWANTSKNYVARCDRNSGFWLVRALAPAHDVHIQAANQRPSWVCAAENSAYPNRRRFPLKRQFLTALFALEHYVHRLKSLAITCSWWQNTLKFSHIFAAECLPIWTQHEISGMWEHNENMVPVVVTSKVSTRLYTIVEHDFNYLSSL